jgi:hypothetical protein
VLSDPFSVSIGRSLTGRPLIEEVAARQDYRNKKHTTADWHFTTAHACAQRDHRQGVSTCMVPMRLAACSSYTGQAGRSVGSNLRSTRAQSTSCGHSAATDAQYEVCAVERQYRWRPASWRLVLDNGRSHDPARDRLVCWASTGALSGTRYAFSTAVARSSQSVTPHSGNGSGGTGGMACQHCGRGTPHVRCDRGPTWASC